MASNGIERRRRAKRASKNVSVLQHRDSARSMDRLNLYSLSLAVDHSTCLVISRSCQQSDRHLFGDVSSDDGLSQSVRFIYLRLVDLPIAL